VILSPTLFTLALVVGVALAGALALVAVGVCVALRERQIRREQLRLDTQKGLLQ